MDNLKLMVETLRENKQYLKKEYTKEYIEGFGSRYGVVDKITNNLTQEEMQILFSLVFNEGYEFRRLIEYFLGVVKRSV